MEKKKKTEEELKTEILNTYAKYHDEISSDRRQVYLGQLWKFVFEWCKDYLFYKKTEEMGVEIVDAVRRCAEKNKTPEKFMEDLMPSLYNARNQSHRNEVEGALREPRIIKNIKKIIEMEEANEGRKLTKDEKVNRIGRLIPLREKTIRFYVENMDRKFEPVDKEGNDNIESKAGHSLTAQGTVSNPQNEDMEDSLAKMIKGELESFLAKKREITRDVYRALFTGICINEGIHYFRKIWPILDSEILEDYWKDPTVVPNDYDIYLKKRPDLKQGSAESGASEKLGKLTKELREAIIENHPEIYFGYKRSKYQK